MADSTTVQSGLAALTATGWDVIEPNEGGRFGSVGVLTAAQSAALAAAPLAQTSSTLAVLNASKTALRDPAGGADIALGGGVGSPGGSTTQLQYNNAGAFGGMAGWLYNSGTGVLTAGGRYDMTMGAGAAGSATLWKTVSQLYPGAVGYSMQFSEGTFTTPFTYIDRVMNFGYNYSGSAPIDATLASIFFQFESAYQLNNDASAAMKVTEWHMNGIAANGAGGGIKRPFSFVHAWDGGFMNVGMSGSQLTVSDLAANNRIVGAYLNGETALNGAITNVATALVVSNARSIANGQNITVAAEGANTLETMTVTAGGGTVNLTVTRGVDGTVASAHGTGAAVLLPAASLAITSSVAIFTDAASSFIIANAAGTINWLVVNSGSTTLRTSLAVSAGVQALAVLTNTAANGTAALLLKANNGAKTATFAMDFGGSLIIGAQGQGGGTYIDCGVVGFSVRSNAYATIINANAANQVGIGLTTQDSWLGIKAGTATVSPFKLTSGVNLTTAQNGAFEYNGTNLFFTRAGAVREGVLTQSTVTTEAGIVMDTSVTVNIGGVSYKLMARAV